MGLDVYVGSLTRYYAGDWELITQTAAKEMGLQLDVIRQHEPDDTIRDPEEIRQRVIGWRAGLSRDIAEDLKDPLDWDESAAAPYFTDKPAWSCHGDLLLWAAYEEQTHISRPESSVEA